MAESGEKPCWLLWGIFIDDSAETSQLWGGGYALGNSDLDACGEHGNIDSEVCYEDPLIYPLPNSGLAHVECTIWEGVYQGVLIILSPNRAQTPRYTPSQIVGSLMQSALFGRGYANIVFSVLGTYFYIVKQRMGTRILRYYSMLSGT